MGLFFFGLYSRERGGGLYQGLRKISGVKFCKSILLKDYITFQLTVVFDRDMKS